MPGPPEATSATSDADAAAGVPVETGPPKRLRGFVRQYCPFKQRGSVRTQGGKNSVSREFFIDPEEAVKCEDLSVGAAISFLLKENRRGQPRACDLTTLIKGVTQREFVTKLATQDEKVDWDKIYTGRIVWYLKEDAESLPASLAKKDPGYGWISCDETKKMFGYDVWAYPSKLAGCKVGDWVSFKVSIDYYWSWPVARDIKPSIPPNGAPSVGSALATSLDDLMKANPAAAGALAQSLDDVINQMEAARAKGDDSIDVPDVPTPCRTTAAAVVNGEEAGQLESNQLVAESEWQRYATEDGQGFWWYRESDGDLFLESNPGPWTKYLDPGSDRNYWWKEGETCLWV